MPKTNRGELVRASDLLPGIVPAELLRAEPEKVKARRRTGPTPVQSRLLEAATASDTQSQQTILYQHSTFCQVYFPYRDPGDEVQVWNRANGLVKLRLKAGELMHPAGHWVNFPLPFGPRCRLVLMHINQLAILTQSPRIVMEDSLTAFVRRVLKLDPVGRNIATVREQLHRLSATSITIGVASPDSLEAVTENIHIVHGFSVWAARDERQRALWSSVIDLSVDYFNTLQAHAVPLDDLHIGALAHSSMALDIYAWLAQRLHRVPVSRPTFVSWTALHSQFGQGYKGDQAIKKFRSVFRIALKQVLALYRAARITEDERQSPELVLVDGKAVWREPRAQGLTLHNSAPPVSKRVIVAS